MVNYPTQHYHKANQDSYGAYTSQDSFLAVSSNT